MQMTLKRKRPDGTPMWAPAHRGLTAERARYVGDPLVLVIAETRAQAEDAADLVQVDYEPLASITATADAVEPGSATVWDECPDNVSNLFEVGDRAATDAAFASAHRVVKRRYVITRVHAQFMEPRGALGVWDPHEERYTLYADVQYPAPRAQRAGHQHLQDPRAPDPRDRRRCRRRLRDQGLAVPRAQARAVGRAQGGPAGQVGVRAPRGHSRRRARARQRHRGRAGAGRQAAASSRCGRGRWPTSAPTSRRIAISWPPSATSRRSSACTRSRSRTCGC